jgi:hypothetical protein
MFVNLCSCQSVRLAVSGNLGTVTEGKGQNCSTLHTFPNLFHRNLLTGLYLASQKTGFEPKEVGSNRQGDIDHSDLGLSRFSQSLQNSAIVSRLGNERFLPNPFPFTI